MTHVPVIPQVNERTQFCKSTEWATLLARERDPDYREAPPQCRGMAAR
jgi:hypothetical protein